jgi:hypothetical protein
MSLEEAIKANTAAIRELIAAYQGALPERITGAASAQAGSASEAKPEGNEPELSYEDSVRKPFLALLNSNRDVAMKLLADLGVPNLKGFENQPEKFAELSQKIQEAQND